MLHSNHQQRRTEDGNTDEGCHKNLPYSTYKTELEKSCEIAYSTMYGIAESKIKPFSRCPFVAHIKNRFYVYYVCLLIELSICKEMGVHVVCVLTYIFLLTF